MMKQGQQTEFFKDIMRNYPTGVTIITTVDKLDNPVGLTANSFTSVSIDPLMILWCIDKNSGSYEVFRDADKFAVNILSGDQKDECRVFASRKEKDRFSKMKWEYSENRLPVLNDVFTLIECEKVEQIEAGDHLILIGKVFDLDKSDRLPMFYHNRNFGPIPQSAGAGI